MTAKIDLRTNDTKNRILLEAQRLYQAGGNSSLSMEKIAEILGLKRPTLYYHFPGGKDQLLVETIKAITNKQVSAWSKAIEAGHNTHTRLRNVLYTVNNYPLRENKIALAIELWKLGEEVQTALKQSYAQLFQLLAEVFQEGIDKGEIREVELELAIQSFIALCDQVETMIVTRENFPELSPIVNRFELEVLTEMMFELWMNGMAVPSSNP